MRAIARSLPDAPRRDASRLVVALGTRLRRAALCPLLVTAGCVTFSPLAGAVLPGASSFAEEVIWGINVGGDVYETRAGELLAADDCGGGAGACGALPEVARTQNELIYRTFRTGDQDYRVPVPPGAYDVVLYFVEPDPEAGDARRFDVLLEGDVRLANFNLLEIKARQPAAAVTRTFPRVAVQDGILDIALRGRVGDAVLAAVQVRRSAFSTAGWELAWSDEFDGDVLSPHNWAVEVWKPGRVNNEIQAYRDDPANVRVEDGRLILEAHPTGLEEPAYTSGRIHSQGRQRFRYGRLDIRARIPEGRGVWPALWLMPDDPYRYATTCSAEAPARQGEQGCDAWPNSGEIDLMEHVGYEPGVVHGTVHTRDYYFVLGTQVGQAIVVPRLGEVFHTFTLLWRESELSMYVDGVRYFSYFEDGVGIGQWPFDHAFHIIMNLAVGGDWGAALGPVMAEDFPRRLEVDFVRLYRPRSD